MERFESFFNLKTKSFNPFSFFDLDQASEMKETENKPQFENVKFLNFSCLDYDDYQSVFANLHEQPSKNSYFSSKEDFDKSIKKSFEYIEKYDSTNKMHRKKIVTHIDSDFFEAFRFIYGLNLSGQKYMTLENTPHNILLKSLNLRKTNLSSLPTNFFPEYSKITTIDLSYNRIKNLDFLDLNRLKSLMFLNLSGNPLEKIDENFFIPDNKLEILDLRNCNLKKIPKSMENCLNLKQLYLSGNQIKETDIDFSKFKKLKHLKLYDTPITNLIALKSPQEHKPIKQDIERNVIYSNNSNIPVENKIDTDKNHADGCYSPNLRFINVLDINSSYCNYEWDLGGIRKLEFNDQQKFDLSFDKIISYFEIFKTLAAKESDFNEDCKSKYFCLISTLLTLPKYESNRKELHIKSNSCLHEIYCFKKMLLEILMSFSHMNKSKYFIEFISNIPIRNNFTDKKYNLLRFNDLCSYVDVKYRAFYNSHIYTSFRDFIVDKVISFKYESFGKIFIHDEIDLYLYWKNRLACICGFEVAESQNNPKDRFNGISQYVLYEFFTNFSLTEFIRSTSLEIRNDKNLGQIFIAKMCSVEIIKGFSKNSEINLFIEHIEMMLIEYMRYLGIIKLKLTESRDPSCAEVNELTLNNNSTDICYQIKPTLLVEEPNFI